MHSALAWLKNPDTSSEPRTKDPATDRARFTQPETTENPAPNRLTAPKGGHWLIAGESLMNIIGESFMKVPRLITPARGLHPQAGSTGQEITQDRQQIAAPKIRSISLHTHAPQAGSSRATHAMHSLKGRKASNKSTLAFSIMGNTRAKARKKSTLIARSHQANLSTPKRPTTEMTRQPKTRSISHIRPNRLIPQCNKCNNVRQRRRPEISATRT